MEKFIYLLACPGVLALEPVQGLLQACVELIEKVCARVFKVVIDAF